MMSDVYELGHYVETNGGAHRCSAIEDAVAPHYARCLAMTAPRIFLRVLLRSLERNARVGELVPVVVRVESDAETRLTLRFHSTAFELVRGASEMFVEPGSHDVEWSVYVKNAAVGQRNIDVLARRDHLFQIATLAVRVHVDGE